MNTATTAEADTRIGFSVTEFAALFGRKKDWGYKVIYAGKVKVIDGLGGILVPTSEIQRIKKSARVYAPSKKRKKDGE